MERKRVFWTAYLDKGNLGTSYIFIALVGLSFISKYRSFGSPAV